MRKFKSWLAGHASFDRRALDCNFIIQMRRQPVSMMKYPPLKPPLLEALSPSLEPQYNKPCVRRTYPQCKPEAFRRRNP